MLLQANSEAQHVDQNHSTQYERRGARYTSDVSDAEWVLMRFGATVVVVIDK